jgi:hypothetical protein
MRFVISPQSQVLRKPPTSCVPQGGAFFAAILLASGLICAQFPALALAQSAASQTAPKPDQHSSSSPATHKVAKPEPGPEVPPPPPMPKWPANDSPSRASVTWDSHGLRIDASNSSLRQILNDVSLETGTKVEGMGSDQRVYGSYGPGQARDVISQLLQGSGYNLLLAGDLGSGAPRQIVLSPRRNGTGGAGSQATAEEQQQEGNPDDDIPDNSEAEEPPQPPPQQPVPMQPNPNAVRPGFGPNGPIRTPQQVMEEMQRQQLLQQQQQQQTDQPNNPPE